MFTNFENIDRALANVEKVCNCFDYFIGFVTGPLRILAGKVMMIAGVALALAGVIAFSITGEDKHLNLTVQGTGYVIHGAADVIKGAVASVNLLGGVFFLLAYDFLIGRLHYSTEVIAPDISTLNPFHPNHQRFLFA